MQSTLGRRRRRLLARTLFHRSFLGLVAGAGARISHTPSPVRGCEAVKEADGQNEPPFCRLALVSGGDEIIASCAGARGRTQPLDAGRHGEGGFTHTVVAPGPTSCSRRCGARRRRRDAAVCDQDVTERDANAQHARGTAPAAGSRSSRTLPDAPPRAGFPGIVSCFVLRADPGAGVAAQ